MAHYDKYTVGAVGHLFLHYERAKKENGEYYPFANQNIDRTKTDGNYNVATEQKLPQLDFLNKRLSEVKVQQRADVNVMCTWIVTLPQGEEAEEQKFFTETFKFLSGRYGKENVISAYVHRDESQPHMHFSFVPVIKDKKKNRYKVCAKELVDRQELSCFHEDLEKYLFGVFGRDMGVRNDATKLGNKSVRELKRETALKEQQTLDAQTKQMQADLFKLVRDIENIKIADGGIKVIKEKRDEVVIPKSDYERAVEALIKKYVYETKAKEAEQRVQQAERERKQAVNRDYEMEIRELKKEVLDLQGKNDFLNYDRGKYRQDSEILKKMIENNPTLRAVYRRIKDEVQGGNQSELD